VAVVDPEVGGERRAVALRLDGGRALVGPDNGLLSLAWERLGEVVEAVEVSRSPYRLEPVSATFHGRDIFAPVAAHLARGVELGELGARVEPDSLTRLDLPAPEVENGAVRAHVLAVDRFGNAGLSVSHAELAGTGLVLGRTVEVEAHGVSRQAVFARSFAELEPGGLLVYEDANRTLALAVSRGDAAAALGIGPDDEVRLRPR
jgi:S-adenosylmethionine hydrolase